MSLLKVRSTPGTSSLDGLGDSADAGNTRPLPQKQRTKASGLLAELPARASHSWASTPAAPSYTPPLQIHLPPRQEKGKQEGLTPPQHSPPLSRDSCALAPASAYQALAHIPTVVGVADRNRSAESSSHFRPSAALAEPFVACSDGVVRRFPPSEVPSRNYTDQLRQGVSYETTTDRVYQKLGGFEIRDEGKAVCFCVNQHPVEPTRIGRVDAYRLVNGRYMVPQPSFRDNLLACELMMLLDHRGLNPADRTLHMPARGFIRQMEDVASSLSRKSGLEPIVVAHLINLKKRGIYGRDRSRVVAWRDLSNKINQFGPCILNKGGHAVMLDKVREDDGNVFLTIREPFHGSHMELREGADFFRAQLKIPEKASIQAIFLSGT